MRIERVGGGPIALVNVGDVRDVLAGRVPPGTEERWIDATPYSFGFMAGSPESIESMGELVLWDGRVYAKATRDAYPVVSGDRFVSTSCVMIPRESEPQFRVPQQKVALTWEEVLQRVSDAVDVPFAVAGSVLFSWLRGKFVVRSPIHGESAYDLESAPIESEGVNCNVVGCAADFTRPSVLLDELQVVLYRHPKDPSILVTHSHVMVLSSEDAVADVLHLFSDSRVAQLELSIFPITQIL